MCNKEAHLRSYLCDIKPITYLTLSHIMDYEQDYTRLNRNQTLWYSQDDLPAAAGGNASGQQQGPSENNGARGIILDNEDFN